MYSRVPSHIRTCVCSFLQDFHAVCPITVRYLMLRIVIHSLPGPLLPFNKSESCGRIPNEQIPTTEINVKLIQVEDQWPTKDAHGAGARAEGIGNQFVLEDEVRLPYFVSTEQDNRHSSSIHISTSPFRGGYIYQQKTNLKRTDNTCWDTYPRSIRVRICTHILSSADMKTNVDNS